MRIPKNAIIAASGLLACAAPAQVAPPAPPRPGGGMMRADTDKDGALSRAEMIADAQARFATMDTNKDGTVTGEERDAAREAMRAQWRGGQRGRGGPGGGIRPASDRVTTREQEVQRAGARFDRLDANGDGTLDAAEIAAMRPMRKRGGDMAPPPPAPTPAAAR